jgi:HlyD family secretion protein
MAPPVSSAPPRPTPLPQRPKGRWFVGLLVLGVAAGVGYQAWDSFFRYRAYGTTTGRLIKVAPVWNGTLQSMAVREGERVRQGQVLLTLDNLEMRQRLAQLDDETRVAQASLEAEAAKLKWQSAFNLDQGYGATALYYQTYSEQLREEARLDDLRAQLKRVETLWTSRAVSREEFDHLRFATKGQEDRVARLKQMLAELKQRADQADSLLKDKQSLAKGLEDAGSEQLKPLVARLETWQSERRRIRERLDQGMITSPVSGLVVKLHNYPGEYCKEGEPLVSIIEDGSLEVVVYMPQGHTSNLKDGAALDVMVEPYPGVLPCVIRRVGDCFEAAPEQIKRHYRQGEKLLPVYLDPTPEAARWMALRVGSVVKVP